MAIGMLEAQAKDFAEPVAKAVLFSARSSAMASNAAKPSPEAEDEREDHSRAFRANICP